MDTELKPRKRTHLSKKELVFKPLITPIGIETTIMRIKEVTPK